jgi:hypothetical protein
MADCWTSLKTYTLFIHDDRYSVPSLDAVGAADDEAAAAVALARLGASHHYFAIEVWDGDRQIAQIDARSVSNVKPPGAQPGVG